MPRKTISYEANHLSIKFTSYQPNKRHRSIQIIFFILFTSNPKLRKKIMNGRFLLTKPIDSRLKIILITIQLRCIFACLPFTANRHIILSSGLRLASVVGPNGPLPLFEYLLNHPPFTPKRSASPLVL